jgi:ATP-dependent helicase/nuclease subunit B
MPGFPRALARTLHELRLAGVHSSQLATGSDSSASPHTSAVADIGRLLARVEFELDRAGVDDRAALFRAARDNWTRGAVRWSGAPAVLLDLPIDSRAEREFVVAIVEKASSALVTVPDGDARAQAALDGLGAVMHTEPDGASPSSDLAHLRRYVFTNEHPPLRERAGDVRLFSAPGEGREAVEIVRRALDEAALGVPFDEMAVLLRSPQQYLGLLEHACARGGVPIYFDRGTRRPDPAGRAFVALLSCGVEGLSA